MSVLALSTAATVASAQAATHDPATRVFRMDGGNASCVFGVNPRGEVQQLYRGGRLAATDPLTPAVPMPEWASFDSSYTTTPQEYAGWGAGLLVEPALKVTFADGNRDRALRYESHATTAGGFEVVLKDIGREDAVWPSDNTDPFDRLVQQDGFTYAYMPQVMMAWATDSRHWLNRRATSLAYRMLGSMQRSLGIGANITRWTTEEMALARRLIAADLEVQTTIVRGDLYRLVSPRDGSEFSATQTVSRDRASRWCSCSSHSTREGRLFPRLKLRGL